MPLFFWFELVLEVRAKILKKAIVFLVEMMTSKSPFEINWPLGMRGDKIWYGRTWTTAVVLRYDYQKYPKYLTVFSADLPKLAQIFEKKLLSGVCSPWFRNWILFWKKWENTAPMLEKSLSITVKVNKKIEKLFKK